MHLANKKANCWVLENPNLPDTALIIEGYEGGKLPPVRNLSEGSDPADPTRLRELIIDPGPRAIRAALLVWPMRLSLTKRREHHSRMAAPE